MTAVIDFNTAARQVIEPVERISPIDAARDFRAACLNAELIPGDVEVSGGKMIRCPVAGDKAGKKSGWFVFYNDDLPAGAYGSWKSGESGTWCAKAETAMSPAEALAYRHKMDKAREAREAERTRLATEAAAAALEQWGKAVSVDRHPYLEKKGVSSFGLKLLGGKLLVPMLDADGGLHGLQSIDSAGEKRFSFGCEKKGRFFLLPGKNKTALCEGYATGASIHMATGWNVLIAFDAGNLSAVAEVWRKRHPADELIVCGDDDAFTSGNPGKAAAEKAAKEAGGMVMLPDFSGLERGRATDWNDLHALGGLEEVRRQLGRNTEYYKVYSCTDILDMPLPKWRIRDVLPETGLATIFGPSRSGKSFLALDMALAIARGVDWFGWKTVQCPVLYVNLESSWGLRKRIKAWTQEVCPDVPTCLNFILDPFDLQNAVCLNAVIKIAAENGVVIIDTLNRASPGTDENSSKDMGLLINAATKIQSSTNGLVLFVTHTGKDQSRGVRGHSSFIAALDAAIEVDGKGDARVMRLDKVKEGEDGIARDFNLKVVNIGYDEDGSEITSCVVEPAVRKEKENTLKPALKYALDSFERARGEAESVHLEDWRAEFYHGHTADSSGAKRLAFNRARKELVESLILVAQDDFYTQLKPSFIDFNH